MENIQNIFQNLKAFMFLKLDEIIIEKLKKSKKSYYQMENLHS